MSGKGEREAHGGRERNRAAASISCGETRPHTFVIMSSSFRYECVSRNPQCTGGTKVLLKAGLLPTAAFVWYRRTHFRRHLPLGPSTTHGSSVSRRLSTSVRADARRSAASPKGTVIGGRECVIRGDSPATSIVQRGIDISFPNTCTQIVPTVYNLIIGLSCRQGISVAWGRVRGFETHEKLILRALRIPNPQEVEGFPTARTRSPAHMAHRRARLTDAMLAAQARFAADNAEALSAVEEACESCCCFCGEAGGCASALPHAVPSPRCRLTAHPSCVVAWVEARNAKRVRVLRCPSCRRLLGGGFPQPRPRVRAVCGTTMDGGACLLPLSHLGPCVASPLPSSN